MKKIGAKAKPADGRTSIVVPLSIWMDDEMDAELVRSLERESARMAEEEAMDRESGNGDESLEEEEIYGILEELSDFEEVKEAAKPDYVAAVADVLSDKLKFRLDLIFVSSGEDGIIATVSSDAVDRLHAVSEAKGHKRLRKEFDVVPDDDWLARPVESWSIDELSCLLESFMMPEGVRLGIIDELASSTDALCCDRLVDHNEYEKRVTELKAIKRAEKELELALEMGESVH
jgi:hypothetical protein